MRKCADVRKCNGKYRVYVVEHFTPCNDIEEIRYSLKSDAKHYMHHTMGCTEMWWEVFDTKEEAQAYLDENRGYTWW